MESLDYVKEDRNYTQVVQAPAIPTNDTHFPWQTFLSRPIDKKKWTLLVGANWFWVSEGQWLRLDYGQGWRIVFG